MLRLVLALVFVLAVAPPALAQGACGGAFTAIPAVQGAGAATPLLNQTVTVQGVVTAALPGLSGFFIQDPSGDNDPSTSDGVFVFIPAANPLANTQVNVGDALRVTGRAAEFNTMTELDNVTTLDKCGTAAAPAPSPVSLPEATNGDLEHVEGMLVTFAQTLTVEQNFFQGRYGQVTLGAGRLETPTNSHPAGSPDAVAQADLNARSLLVLDDGRTSQNPNPIPYLAADGTLRAGDIVTGVTGVIDFGPITSDSDVRDYRLQPTQPVVFTRVNQRELLPPLVGGSLKVASFNVLNYFNGDGRGGGFPTSRGADTAAEFERQRAKIIAALLAIDADVVGLMEMENDGAGPDSAVEDLVNGLNAALGSAVYRVVVEPGPGSDEIKVAMLYKSARLGPIGAAVNYQVADDVYGAELFDRPPLAQTFNVFDNGGLFTVVVNHFKSKSGCPTTGPDLDQGDGQGCWNAKRVRQASQLLVFLSSLRAAMADDDVLVIGDLNSYGFEDPIRTLVAGGLVNEIAQRVASPYSYVFDGLSGYLDHALTSASLSEQVTGVAEWHINADEPSVIDYNLEFKPQDLYAPTPFRASDHDPVVVGLEVAGRTCAQNCIPK
jgi:predicted extracellular nuclease